MSQSIPADEPRLLTVRDVAKKLQLSSTVIYSLVSDGTLPALRVGQGRGSIRFRNRDVEEFLEDCVMLNRRPVRGTKRPAVRHSHEFKHLKMKKGGRR